ncbi:hypothetical protein NT6N_19790 [Oceaniferula spumae]|uniref:DUF4034 domain-containing protein n=1 Tax=Oceaniferula spumae TaxID=2979115 RepID=A0AAT9FLP4_9BACT
MNRFLAICGAILLAAMPLEATSVDSVDHTCPACGRQVQLTVLMSYSQFGEQPRNLSSMFGGITSPQMCPYDLFIDYASRWEKPEAGVKQRIEPILKKRTIVLTEAEQAARKEHGDEFFEPVKEILWYRTCLPHLKKNKQASPERDLSISLRLYYNAYDEPLRSFYRNLAITRLAELPKAAWLKDEVGKLVYAYLHAELLREAGRDQQAIDAFRKVLSAYKKFPGKTEDNQWIEQWAEEQLTRTLFSKQSSAELKENINLQWLDTEYWQEDDHPSDTSPEKWMKHRLALSMIQERHPAGQPDAGEILNAVLDHNVLRLMALADTAAVDYRTLTKHKPLKIWLTQLRKELKNGTLFRQVKDAEQKKNLERQLGRLLGKNMFGDEWPVTEELLPHFEKWRMARDSTPPLPEGWTWQQGTDGYKSLIDDEFKNDLDLRRDAMFAFLQVLPQVPDQPKKWSWDVAQGLQTLAENKAHFHGRLTGLLEKQWEGEFWKSCVAYLNGSGKAEAFTNSALVKVEIDQEKRYENFIYGFLGDANDSTWKTKALEELSGDQWIKSDVYRYLDDLSDPSLVPVLEKRIAFLRARMKKKEREKHENEMFGYELSYPESILLRHRMKSLTYGQ